MSKKLPKAIGQTIDDLRRTKPNTRDESKTTRVSLASIPSPVAGGRTGDVLAEEVRNRLAGGDAAARQPEKPAMPAATKAEPVKVEPTKSEAPPAKAEASVVTVSAPVKPAVSEKPAASPVVVDRDAELHRAKAREIVERHATFSAIGGFVPLPLIEIASMTAIIHRMVKTLAAHYDVTFDRDRTRAVVAGLIGGLAPLGLGALTTASLVKLIPGANLIGLGVSSMAAAEGTRRIGYVFIAHFEGGGTLLDFRHKPE